MREGGQEDGGSGGRRGAVLQLCLVVFLGRGGRYANRSMGGDR